MDFEPSDRPELHFDVLATILAAGDDGSGQSLNWLTSCALVNHEWNEAAIGLIYRDVSKICRHNGFHLPRMVATLRKRPNLASCVRKLEITSVLEGAFYSDQTLRFEGDAFARLIEQLPNLLHLTVANFELATKFRVLTALRALRLETFTIRLYLESERRSSKFSKLIPYFDWDVATLMEIMPFWTSLHSFKITHCPDAYHVRPDLVLHSPVREGCLPPLQNRLTSLILRETKIDDSTLFHLIGQSRLKVLSIMSCHGITSSAITKQGLTKALRMVSHTVEDLTIMTPWADSTTGSSQNLVLDEALRYCSALRRLTVCGYDCSDAIFEAIPSCVRLEHLGITDFESVTFNGIRKGLKLPVLKSLRTLAIWQRNGGMSMDGIRLTQGWIAQLLEIDGWDVLSALSQRSIKVSTAWESRLLSGGLICEYSRNTENTLIQTAYHDPLALTRILPAELLPLPSRFTRYLAR